MNFLGVGPLELFFLIIIAVLIFGPKDLIIAGRKLGQLLNQIKKSEVWHSITELRERATQAGKDIINESGIEEVRQELEVVPNLDEFRKELDQFGFKPNSAQPSSDERNLGAIAERPNVEQMN